MGKISDWLSSHLETCDLSDNHKRDLARRGVDEDTSVSFYTWKRADTPAPCPVFSKNFGPYGEKAQGFLSFPIKSPKGEIIGIEARRALPDGSKKVYQYRTPSASWNPYMIGSDRAFQSLWNGSDIWVVEGVFDLVSLEKVVAPCDTVCSTLRAGMDQVTLNMITRFSGKGSTVFIVYDNDETGRKKSQWLNRQLTNEGVRSVVWTYKGKDPNEVWKAGGERMLRRMFL